MTIIDCHRFKVTAIENDSLLTCQTEVLLVFKKKTNWVTIPSSI